MNFRKTTSVVNWTAERRPHVVMEAVMQENPVLHVQATAEVAAAVVTVNVIPEKIFVYALQTAARLRVQSSLVQMVKTTTVT